MTDPPAHLPAPSRRRFLGTAAAAIGGAVLGFGALDGLIARRARAAHGHGTDRARLDEGGYGRLREVTRVEPHTGFEQTLLLPKGFDFALFGIAGTLLDDDARTPLAHDGMAAFSGPGGTVRLVRNHEDRNEPADSTPSGNRAEMRYDRFGGGGTSTLQLAMNGRGEPQLEGAWMSLAGTTVNCAGGPTPWGSWLTCEETTNSPTTGWEKRHGYVFEVPSSAETTVEPVPLTAMGRFVHEAAAVDPHSGIVYETEDRDTAGFYRFVPNTPGKLAEGGRLQMLKVRDAPRYDTRQGQRQGESLPVEWVDIDDPDPHEADLDPLAVYRQGLDREGATFARIEGCWWAGAGAVYFCCTDGGDACEGQVWEFAPAQRSGASLTLVYESPDPGVLSHPDNMTVSPNNALLLCEDPPSSSRDTHRLQGLTRDGRVFPLCESDTGGEWAGATFDPDGHVLFVNLQGPTSGEPTGRADAGRTIAIWGPWERGAL